MNLRFSKLREVVKDREAWRACYKELDTKGMTGWQNNKTGQTEREQELGTE